jgi:tetratricopeptide (TPR) repeat protein
MGMAGSGPSRDAQAGRASPGAGRVCWTAFAMRDRLGRRMEQEPDPATHSRLRAAIPALVALVTFVAFLPALAGRFLNWDDNLNFLENPHYRGFSPANLKWMWTSFHLGHWHPLTWMSLALDYCLWGLHPAGYHLTSMLIHSANAALLYGVTLVFLRLGGRPDVRWPAVVGTLAYSLHPMRVESVAWITERRDVLCGFFVLLSVLAYLRRVEAERKGEPGVRWLALSIAAFAASLLSKALGVALPAVLLILDVYPLGRFKAESRGRVLLEKLPYVLLSGLDAVFMVGAMRDLGAVHAVGSYNLLERAAQAAYGLCFYPLKTLWPFHLAPLYPLELCLNPFSPIYLGAMAGVGAGTLLLFIRRREWPGALAAWLATAVLLSPVLGVAVTGLQIVADRYSYLALLPAAVLMSLLLARCSGKQVRAVFAVATPLLFGLGALTLLQCGVWRDSLTLWNHELAVQPNYFAYYSRGAERMLRGDVECGMADWDASIALVPDWATSRLDRAVAKANRGDYPGAIADYTAAILLDPRPVNALTGRAMARSKKGDLPGALADCEQAARTDPSSVVPFVMRGLIRADHGDLTGAIADYTQALSMDANEPDVYAHRGLALVKSGKYAAAIPDYTRALERRPDQPEWLSNRGLARSLAGDAKGALEDFDRSLRLNLTPATLLRRAGIRGMTGDLDGAIADCSEAIRLQPDLTEAYARRGMARMERRDTAGAIGDFEQALERLPAGSPQRAPIEEFLRRAKEK